MGQTVMLTGLVLSAMPVGEYDKRIQILTRERGKVAAFARGARRPNSAFLAAANPFCFGKFEVYEGRSAYNLAKAEISNYFRELAKDLEAVSYGFYFLEMASYYTQENMDGTDYLNLIYVTLKALLNASLDNRLVRRVYELRILVLYGEYPQVFSCMGCGRKDELRYFSIRHHGCVCPRCVNGEKAIPMEASVLYALQYIIQVPLEKLYTFALGPAALDRLDAIISGYLKQFHNHKFHSQDMLDKG